MLLNLRRYGAGIAELQAATGWQRHSARGYRRRLLGRQQVAGNIHFESETPDETQMKRPGPTGGSGVLENLPLPARADVNEH